MDLIFNDLHTTSCVKGIFIHTNLSLMVAKNILLSTTKYLLMLWNIENDYGFDSHQNQTFNDLHTTNCFKGTMIHTKLSLMVAKRK